MSVPLPPSVRPSLETLETGLNVLPIPAFVSVFQDFSRPVLMNPLLGQLLEVEKRDELTLKNCLQLEGKSQESTLSWERLQQEALPNTVLCRTPLNERYKLSLYCVLTEGETPHVMGLLTPFQEDVALTQAHHDFVSIVSHEFRTPLTSIRGFSDTILHYGSNLQPAQQERFIKIIRDQADRLSRMVENVLIMSKLGQDQKKPKFQPVALSKMFSKVEGALQGKGIAVDDRFKYELEPKIESVWAEPDSLEQVLLNLMDNAAKYSPAEKPITITLEHDPEDPRRYARISVRDEGHGMTPEQCEKLFSKFYRTSHHMTQQVEGSGLGLYITKSLVQRMEGRIGVESEVGKGTAFWFTVPLNTQEHQDRYRRSIELGGEYAAENGEGGPIAS